MYRPTLATLDEGEEIRSLPTGDPEFTIEGSVQQASNSVVRSTWGPEVAEAIIFRTYDRSNMILPGDELAVDNEDGRGTLRYEAQPVKGVSFQKTQQVNGIRRAVK